MITTTDNKTIVSLANDLSDSLIRKTRSNGEKFTCFKDGLDSVAPWIQEAVCSLMDFPNDTYYDLIARVASFISEQDEASDFDDIQDLLYELEPDCYTSDLTACLNASIDHVYYINDYRRMLIASASASYTDSRSSKCAIEFIKRDSRS